MGADTKPAKAWWEFWIALGGLTIAAFAFWIGWDQFEVANKTYRANALTGFLGRFDDEATRQARTTLVRYQEAVKRLCPVQNPNTCGDDFVKQKTTEYFGYYVYWTVNTKRPADLPLPNGVKTEKFILEVDQSRRRVKNFFESVMVFQRLQLTKREDVAQRWGKSTGVFLRRVWLPVELGQNQALRYGRDDQDQKAESLVKYFE